MGTTVPGGGNSESETEAIISEIHEEWPHAGYVAFVHDGRVRAYLWPGEENAAAEITDRYGDAVEVWLGRQRYPDGAIGEECFTWLTETVDPFVDVDASALEVEVGGRFTGSATLTNAGSQEVSVANLALEAVVVESGTTKPLAVVTGPDSSNIADDVIAAGGTTTATFVGGTASCVPEVRYTLPPGDYEYRLLVTGPRAPEVDDMQPVGFWSEPFPLTVR